MKYKLLLLVCLLLAGCSKSEVKKKPNIVVIMTDQERHTVHWPKGWAEKNLPAMNRLKKQGMTFHRAYTAACECSPSRAVILSSEYYPINKVPHTPPNPNFPTAAKLMDIGSLLKDHSGYKVVWKGKWHLSTALAGGKSWAENDIADMEKKYDIFGWTPPDAGDALSESQVLSNGTVFNGLTTLGGGYANNDHRYLYGNAQTTQGETKGWGEGVLDYLKEAKAEGKPFCLFISLVNPHDVWVYPGCWESAGYQKEAFANLGIELPSNYADDLTTKPSVQLKARVGYNEKAPISGVVEEKEYVNFYAYLHKVVDSHIGTVLDALDSLGLTDETIIIRTADHGELGLSHGMREKSYTAYEEMIHVPFIVSNPKMFPAAQETEAFYSHLDMLPTIAELAGVPNFEKYGKGVSLVPVLKNPHLAVQDSILFSFDDLFVLPPETPGGHIRAVREGDWMYAVYYSENGSNFEYEMYNLRQDPGELHNLLHGTISPDNAATARRLHAKLKLKIDAAKALPADFCWPTPGF